MTVPPTDYDAIYRIYFIAEDATGPHRRVIKVRLFDGVILSFETDEECAGLLRWLSDHNRQAVTELEALLHEAKQRNVEVVVWSNEK